MEWWLKSVLVFLGAGCGANGRYWLGRWVQFHMDSGFPWGTFVINATGSLLIGLVYGVLGRVSAGPGWQLLLVVGLLGGYTTFSSFSYETLNLLRDREYLWALGNVFGSVAFGLVGAVLGELCARALTGGKA